ncbi:MAG: TetR family transcriptional regulator [Burkholderiales bacterium]|nr:TetR family transcriptional regulator [Burkholderiales bacterium]
MGRKRQVGTPEGETKVNGILDAAAAVFMKLGFAAASLDDISDSYGATKGIIYYHFRSKTALFFAVQRRAMELTRAAIEPAATAQGPAARRLYDMAFAHTLLMMEHLDYLRVAGQGLEMQLSGRTTSEERTELKRIITMRDANERLYSTVLEDGAASGEFRQIDVRIAVKPLLGALNWTSRWYQPRKGETRPDREAIAAEVARYAVRGLIRDESRKVA